MTTLSQAAVSANTAHSLARLRVVIRGAVQGVGFRPFIYRLATEMSLPGWVSNTASGVFIEVEGRPDRLREFLLRVEQEKPAISFIQSLESSYLDPAGFTSFDIRESTGGEKTVLVLPEIATCPDCLREIFDPQNRRYRYPFTNCTNCGPRFTIIEALPYDRPATTMKFFRMCPECEREYKNPLDRRFHAQPNACPACGPYVEFWDGRGARQDQNYPALKRAALTIFGGRIVAVKGLGGFHLMADARNTAAIELLRKRKQREEKPFALMYPSLEAIKGDCELNALEERLLRSPESPIVLLRRRAQCASGVSDAVAPRNPHLGVMLAYTPLHHLLMAELNFPVVATSGNISDEPICIDQNEVVRRLGSLADAYLVHNRPIIRHADDSIVRVVMDRELVMRRARGFAPLPVRVEQELPPILAVGAHQKNTIAASVGQQIFVSQHIGDLETEEAYSAFERVIESFRKLYEFTPQAVACDMHPNYMSSEYAKKLGLPVIEVQHHYAHVLACMAENGLSGSALGISWDGSGYGTDGTVWGGEFLRITKGGYDRFAHLRQFRLPGSEKAVKEPRRVAAGLLYEAQPESLFADPQLGYTQAFDEHQREVIAGMLAKGVNSPKTSSAGRLFDAVASLVDLRQTVRFEGQAAMELEACATTWTGSNGQYEFSLTRGASLAVDWSPMITEIMNDVQRGEERGKIAHKFHNTLAAMMIRVAQECGEEHVILTGGCFQNRLLTELAVKRLSDAGFRVYWHQRIPPNDGGIAVGQIMAAARVLNKEH